MSADNNGAEEEEILRCASCGGVGGDNVKLRNCSACHLVRYCGVKCQKEHRPKHKKECRKRAAELRDELLFKQPESSHLGDCPICLIPLPLSLSKSIMMGCCSKMICDGCNLANKRRELEGSLQQSCPFCRNPSPRSQVECDRIMMKRVGANDPAALRQVGTKRNLRGDYNGAIENWTRAAELGDVVAHFELAWSYKEGEGVEKDGKKEVYHLEQAAIGGHPEARCRLGVLEFNNGRYDRAIRHWIIAAHLGDDNSMEKVKNFQGGLVSKEDFASTLRAHHAAVDAMKSPQREEAEADVEYCEFRQNRTRSESSKQ